MATPQMVALVAVVFVIVISATLLLLFTTDLSTQNRSFCLFSPFPSSSVGSTASSIVKATMNHPLGVFMYELEPRFNLGMLRRDMSNFSSSFPAWPGNSGLKRQHSVEYWMMASLVHGDSNNNNNSSSIALLGKEMEAVRVDDPEAADVFFVPFFSSLSFNTHGKNMTDPDTEFDRQLQVDILDFLRKSKYWQRSAGRDHVIPMHHPNAFRFLRDQVNASILVVADFGRYSKSLAHLRKDVVAPYVHVVESFTNDNPPDPFESRSILLFFRGRTMRKAEGKVRSKLAKILKDYDDVRYEDSFATGEGIKSEKGMRSSKFCLSPAGDTPSSCRLFDAIVSHCVPIIVSDRIELPFEDELDYSEFSLFFSVKEALQPNYVINQLRKISKSRWTEMWWRLKNISHHFEYQYPPKKEDAVNMIWRQVRHKLPAAKLTVHRSHRLKIPDWWDRQR